MRSYLRLYIRNAVLHLQCQYFCHLCSWLFHEHNNENVNIDIDDFNDNDIAYLCVYVRIHQKLVIVLCVGTIKGDHLITSLYYNEVIFGAISFCMLAFTSYPFGSRAPQCYFVCSDLACWHLLSMESMFPTALFPHSYYNENYSKVSQAYIENKYGGWTFYL